MTEKKKKMITGLLAFIMCCAIGYLGYTAYGLSKERDRLTADLAAEQRKYKLIQRKYAEQKAVNATLQRGKLAAEGSLRQTQQELEAALADNEKLTRALAGAEKKFEAKIAGLEKNIETYKDQMARLVENRDQYKARLAETVAVVKERNEMIYSLTSEKEALTADLQETRATLRRTVKHNARLAELSEELVVAYEKKGVGDSLLGKEPLTQIEKVEVEQLVQEYRDRIDNDNLKLIDQTKK